MATARADIASDPNSAEDEKEPVKKRKFFKNIKQLFTRKKRTKSKDGDSKSQSVANVSSVKPDRDDTTDEEGPFPPSAGISMSHDSVFTSEISRDGNPDSDISRSMEGLYQGKGVSAFKNELASKLQGRLPGSSKTSTGSRPSSANDNVDHSHRARGDRSFESDHSLASMAESSDNELEEDFFKEKWASSTSLSKRTTSPDPPSGGSDMDLDFITSSASLNVSAAKHKIAVKQKGKRISTQIRTRKTHSPKPSSSGQMHSLEEEAAINRYAKFRQESQSEDTAPKSSLSVDSLSEVKSLPRDEDEPLPDYDMITEDTTPQLPTPDQRASPIPRPILKTSSSKITTTSRSPPKATSSATTFVSAEAGEGANKFKSAGISRSVKSDSRIGEDSNGGANDEKADFTKIVLKKTSSMPASEATKNSNDKEDNSPSENNFLSQVKLVRSNSQKLKDLITADNKGSDKSETVVTSGVVMRQKNVIKDERKRQTVSGDMMESNKTTTNTPFGERKILPKRSSWIDSNKKNDDFDKENVEKSETGGNEFSAVFSKFQRRASQKREVDSPVKVVDVVITEKTEKSVIIEKNNKNSMPLSGAKTSVVSSHNVPPTQSSLPVSTKTTSSVVVEEKSNVQKPKTLLIEKPLELNKQSKSSPDNSGSITPGEKITTGDVFPKKTVAETTAKSTTSSSNDEKPKPIPPKSAVKNQVNDNTRASFVLNKSSAIGTKQSFKSNEKTKTSPDQSSDVTNSSSSSVAYRRPSPLNKDRARSQTLPENPVLSSAAGQNVNNASKSSDTATKPNPAASPQRSKSMVKKVDGDSETGDGKPAWMALAMKKTAGWNKDEKDDTGNQNDSAEKNKEAPVTSAPANDSKKSIKDLMRNFQA